MTRKQIRLLENALNAAFFFNRSTKQLKIMVSILSGDDKPFSVIPERELTKELLTNAVKDPN